MDQEFTPEQVKALETIEKLMRLADKNPSTEEAMAAAAKAQELLLAYNLEQSHVGKAGASSDSIREQQKIKGGMYKYQRYLWHAICKLNFCHYFTTEVAVKRTYSGRTFWGKEFQHVVIGRRINVKASLMMADYLQGAIERLVAERYPQNSQRFMREAIAFREGAADNIYWRLLEKRAQMVKDEEERIARDLARRGVSTAQALTIGTLTQQEEDANMDFIYGEGYSARKRARRAELDRQQKEAEEAYTRWAAANPEEARKEEQKREEAQKKRRDRKTKVGRSAEDRRMSSSAYWQGNDAGAQIGLDPQTSAAPKPKAIT